MDGRKLTAVAVCGVGLLGLDTTAAWAATVDQITTDAKDGQLDGAYSRSELQAAISSPLLKVYGGRHGVEAVRSALGAQTAGAGTSGDLPFTGVETMTFAVLATTLLAAGFVLRRQSRPDA
jgi:hypothetical protein